MAEEDDDVITEYLRAVKQFQIPNNPPLSTIYWPGSTIGNRTQPRDIRAMAMLRSFRPVMSCHHINITEARISSGGLDAQDEFWFQQGGRINALVAAWDEWTAYQEEMRDFIERGNSMDAKIIVADTDVDVVSDAAHLMTCPANRARKLTVAMVESDRAPTANLILTPNGGTASILRIVSGGVVGGSMVLLGGVASVAGASRGSSIHGPHWMRAGDTAELLITNFVGGDVVRKEFVFEEYDVT